MSMLKPRPHHRRPTGRTLVDQDHACFYVDKLGFEKRLDVPIARAHAGSRFSARSGHNDHLFARRGTARRVETASGS